MTSKQTTSQVDDKDVSTHPGKDAMSKALGQAFLAHQVRQLEAGAGPRGKPPRRGTPRRQLDVMGRDKSPQNQAQHTAAPRLMANQTIPSIIILDASVFVHSLDQIKKWLSAERPERLVVPLEGTSESIPIMTV